MAKRIHKDAVEYSIGSQVLFRSQTDGKDSQPRAATIIDYGRARNTDGTLPHIIKLDDGTELSVNPVTELTDENGVTPESLQDK